MPMKNKYRWPGFLNLWVDWRPPECGWLEIHGWDDALSPTFSQSRLAFSRYLRTIYCQGESNIRFRYAIRYIKEKFITASGGFRLYNVPTIWKIPRLHMAQHIMPLCSSRRHTHFFIGLIYIYIYDLQLHGTAVMQICTQVRMRRALSLTYTNAGAKWELL